MDAVTDAQVCQGCDKILVDVLHYKCVVCPNYLLCRGCRVTRLHKKLHLDHNFRPISSTGKLELAVLNISILPHNLIVDNSRHSIYNNLFIPKKYRISKTIVIKKSLHIVSKNIRWIRSPEAHTR